MGPTDDDSGITDGIYKGLLVIYKGLLVIYKWFLVIYKGLLVVYKGLCVLGTASRPAMIVYWLLSGFYFATDGVVLIHVTYFAFAVCGNAVSPFFLCFHLFDLVYTSETLKNVLRAVTFNGAQLLMTAGLCIIVVYVYSIFGFAMLRNNFFNDDIEDPGAMGGMGQADTLFDCLMVTIREGLINGGGMGDYLQPRAVSDVGTFLGRFAFDLSFFIIIIIILMNIIFGIIIDTFSAMREVTESKAADMKSTCSLFAHYALTICSLFRYLFHLR